MNINTKLCIFKLVYSWVCLGDVTVGGNFVFCLIVVVIFIGLGRAYRLGEGEGVGFWTYQLGGKPHWDETIFMGQVDPLRHHVKILILQL